nr:immunoglobulin light chain junction region [Macaca mulatta]MOV74355.1 immunoglobulin light chain junction region [Macaca mulatta]MOV74406.1 immunoglobulin light chain junction region [Macaca mulatta]MOV74446.1 immunoglobulin light chain junction region [Macaca mulatta]MOV74531.1 immunoglobulin light chain junction region [Macaca mulatta]
CQHHNTYPWTF